MVSYYILYILSSIFHIIKLFQLSIIFLAVMCILLLLQLMLSAQVYELRARNQSDTRGNV